MYIYKWSVFSEVVYSVDDMLFLFPRVLFKSAMN